MSWEGSWHRHSGHFELTLTHLFWASRLKEILEYLWNKLILRSSSGWKSQNMFIIWPIWLSCVKLALSLWCPGWASLYGSPYCPQDCVFPPWPQAGVFSSHFLFLILCKNLPAAERRKSQITKNHVKTNDFSNCLGFKPFTQNSSLLCGIVDTNQWLAAWLLGTCVFLSRSPRSQEDVECGGKWPRAGSSWRRVIPVLWPLRSQPRN